MGFAISVSCDKNFHRAPLGASIGRINPNNYLGSTFYLRMRFIRSTKKRFQHERPWIQWGFPAFRKFSASESNFQMIYLICSISL